MGVRERARSAGRALPWVGVAVTLVAVLVLAVQAVWPTHAATTADDAIGAIGGLPSTGGEWTPGPATSPSAGLGSTSPSPPGGARRSPPPRPRWDAFATLSGVRLYLPAPRPVAVAYHEASLEGALGMRPLGHVLHNYNRYKFRSRGPTPGPGYIVMSSRGRSQPATSAADIVLRPGTPVRTPVDGRVVGLRTYRLYCRYPDARVAIQPSGRPDLRLVMLHVTGLQVHRGDRVFATLSVIGRPRQFPFRSQTDDYQTGGNPHVHIEVEEPSPAPVPTCPARRG
jgi:hypothetical protein